jgi:hypothetical protein
MDNLSSNENNTQNSSAIKLQALEKEFDVVMKMYEEAYNNYTANLSKNTKVKEEDTCASYTGSSVGISQECYDKIWKDAGCTSTAQSADSDFVKTQTLDFLKQDSEQFATLNDEEHNQGCYGSNEKPPTQSTQSTENTVYNVLKGRTFWGTSGIKEGPVNSVDECKNMCIESKCTGATYNASKNYCWARKGDRAVSAGLSEESAIIPQLKQDATVLKMLNDKLIKLNSEINVQLKEVYGTTDANEIQGQQVEQGPKGQQGQSSETHTSKRKRVAEQLKQLTDEKGKIHKYIKNIDEINAQYDGSDMYVTQAHASYTLYFVIAIIIFALVIQNNMFSIITVILLLLIVTVNTTIFSMIAIFLLLLIVAKMKTSE